MVFAIINPMGSEEIAKTVYFVRHGQSVDNISPVFQSTDSPLSEQGRQQADSIAERLVHLSFEALISSPLPRAEETAERIAERTGITPIFSDLFVERIKPSSVDGRPYDDAEAALTWHNWQESFYVSGARVEDGENFDDIVDRGDKALGLLEGRPEPSMVVVTHGYFLRTMLARVLVGDQLTGPVMRNFQTSAEMENTGITVLRRLSDYERDDHWQLWTYNDHSHFAE